jgi:peptidoglycan/xylan/chitin deacetylase (PgdA/CDA1 family)
MYHGFGTRSRGDDPHNLFVPVDDLERQIRLVARLFRPLDLSGYLEGLRRGRWPSRSILVTIDDGYVSTLEVAAPLLRRHRVPAVLFALPGLLGGTTAWMPDLPPEPLLSAEQLRELRGFGIEIGAHGLDHRLLPGLAPEELRRQVAGARDGVAAVTGAPPRAFAYPEGAIDDATLEAVREAGYEVAFSVHRGGGRYSVPRIPVTTRDSFLTFGGKLLPGYRRLERAVRGRPRRVAARLLGHRPV